MDVNPNQFLEDVETHIQCQSLSLLEEDTQEESSMSTRTMQQGSPHI